MSGSTTLFHPYRAIGMVSSGVPSVLSSRGDSNFIIVSVGNAFQVYNAETLNLVFVSPRLPKRISALAVWHEVTFCACGTDIAVVYQAERVKVLSKHVGDIVSLTVIGNYLISCCSESEMIVWSLTRRDGSDTTYETTIELDSATEEAGLGSVSSKFTPSCVLHPHTYLNKLLVGSTNGSLELWNIRSKNRIYRFKCVSGKEITSIEQSGIVDVVGIGLSDGEILICNLRFDKVLIRFFQSTGAVTSLSFRSDNKSSQILASSDNSGTITFWDLNKKGIQSRLPSAHLDTVGNLVFLAGQPLMLSSSRDNSLKLWIFDKLDGTARLLRSREGHVRPPDCVQFYGGTTDEAIGNSVDGNLLQVLSCGQDSTLRSFHVTRDSLSCELSQGAIKKKAHSLGKSLRELRLSPIVAMAASETRNGDWPNIVTCHENNLNAYTWSFKKKALGDTILRPAVKGSKNDPSVDYRVTKKRRKTKHFGFESGLQRMMGKASSVALSSCGCFAVVGTTTGMLFKFAVQSGILRGRFPKDDQTDVAEGSNAHQASISSSNTCAMNKKLISVSLDSTLKVWDFEKYKLLATVNTGSGCTRAVLHRNSNLLAVACDDFSVHLYDVFTTPPRLVRNFKGHSRNITDIEITPDGRWLLTSSLDCCLRVWDIAANVSISWSSFPSAITSMSLSPSGEFLATSHVEDLGIYVWTNVGMFEAVNHGKIPTKPTPFFLPTALPQKTEAGDRRGKEVADEPSAVTLQDLQHSNTSKLTTLSSVSRSHWQQLSSLATIKMRNKPTEAPKAPERAPFFIPSRSAPSNPVFAVPEEKSSSADGDTGANSKSRIINDAGNRHLTTLMKHLGRLEEENGALIAMGYMKSLSAPMIDVEFRNLCFGVVDDIGKSFLSKLLNLFEGEVQKRADFEVVQSYINLVLKIHLETILSDPELVYSLNQLKISQKGAWNNLRGWAQKSLCLIEHFLVLK